MHRGLAACLGWWAVALAAGTGGALAAGPSKGLPAFPGAEGFGASAKGGRGGKVHLVTNLKDGGAGSLRAAVEAKGARIVVFRVSGNIVLRSPLVIRSGRITIAGQTAPGGVCLANHALSVAADEVIVRYLRVRLGDRNERDQDAMSGRGCKNVILDHCSASWGIDECVSFYGTEDLTIQWCLISESLCFSHHEKGRHGYGGIWGGKRSSFHHNLLAHHSSRTPRFAGKDDYVDHRNNVIYNWGFNSAYGAESGRINLIANYYKPGPATRANVRGRIVEPCAGGDGKTWACRLHVAGNHVVGSPAVTADNWNGGVQGRFPKAVIKADKPFAAAPVRTQPAEKAYELVLAYAGANLPTRDAADARIVREVRTATATYGGKWGPGKGIIDSQDTVGGWPKLASKPPPPDGDADGMPDAWERTHGLNPKDAADAAADADRDGYTNIEEYLNATDPTAYVDYRDPKNNVHSLHGRRAAGKQ